MSFGSLPSGSVTVSCSLGFHIPIGIALCMVSLAYINKEDNPSQTATCSLIFQLRFSLSRLLLCCINLKTKKESRLYMEIVDVYYKHKSLYGEVDQRGFVIWSQCGNFSLTSVNCEAQKLLWVHSHLERLQQAKEDGSLVFQLPQKSQCLRHFYFSFVALYLIPT